MLNRILTIGAAMMIAAIPATAQDRGTVEFGGFLSYNMFEDAYQMNNAIGFGGRIATFLDPRWSLEFDINGGTATRPSGLADRSFTMLDARVAFIPVKIGVTSLILGAGMSHVDANVGGAFTDQNFGYNLLIGGKLAMTETAALRLDYVHYLNDGATHGSVRAGLALYRRPEGKNTVVHSVTQAPATAQRPDSVSAAETRRLRQAAMDYQNLRDSLARNAASPMTASSVAALATMLEMVHFERDESSLDAVARAILDDKVVIFKANPEMKIVITGYASSPGTDAYNMALGLRRANASRDYLVSQGVAMNRIEIATRGENNLMVEGPSDVANAANRRGQFRLLIANPYLLAPKP
jgi:peptidoglycan-associated lipoprotein